MLTKQEAMKLLDAAPKTGRPSRVNPTLSQFDAYLIVRKYVEKLPDDAKITGIMEKRVYQIARNQIRPQY